MRLGRRVDLGTEHEPHSAIVAYDLLDPADARSLGQTLHRAGVRRLRAILVADDDKTLNPNYTSHDELRQHL